jgi:hypothetical protein
LDVKKALYLFVLSDDVFGLIATASRRWEMEEGYAYVACIKSEPSLKALSAGRSGKVAKERVVGRLPILCVNVRRVEFALLRSASVRCCVAIFPNARTNRS